MMVATLNPEREAELRAMWPDAAVSLDSMTRHFSMHGHTIRRIAERLKLGPRPNFWGNGVFEAVKARYAAGETPQEIADSLGVTRNTINAKLDRAGLLQKRGAAALDRSLRDRMAKARTARPVKAIAAPKPPKPAPAPKAAPVLKLAGRGTVFEEAEARPSRAEPVQRHEKPGTATILTLTNRMCKWPIGSPDEPDFTFCGCKVEAAPYCVDHAKRAYRPSSPNKRATEPFQARATARFA